MGQCAGMSLEGTGDIAVAEPLRRLAREPNTQDEQAREDHDRHPKGSTCPAAAKHRVEDGVASHTSANNRTIKPATRATAGTDSD